MLRKAARHVTQFYDEVIRVTGLKTSQLSLLRAVYFRPGRELTMGELAEIMVMDRSTLGHNLRPLERDGLVRLQASPADRRVRIVTLSKKGRAKCEAGAESWARAQAAFESAFGAESTGRLRQDLFAVASLDFASSPGRNSKSKNPGK